jgi:hypothetical protein
MVNIVNLSKDFLQYVQIALNSSIYFLSFAKKKDGIWTMFTNCFFDVLLRS